MIAPARLRLIALAAALPLLSGCVAAAAVPVLAAGGVLKTRMDRGDRAERAAATTAAPRVPIDIGRRPGTAGEPAAEPLKQEYTLADGTQVAVLTGRPGAPATAPVAVPAPASPAVELARTQPAVTVPQPGLPTTVELPDGTRAQVIAGTLPLPGAAGLAPAGAPGYDAFYNYAATTGTLPIAGSQRMSAMLKQPGSLRPATRECSVHPAAVLIDLDPGPATFDPTAARADPALAATLARLRAQEIAIGWVSALTADRAGAVRRALVASGLDAQGRDELALLRYPEERKQTRREDFAKEFCVVAIAGDERGDFDELFQYLKNPAVAAPLEPLMGKGWFLIPQPLN